MMIGRVLKLPLGVIGLLVCMYAVFGCADPPTSRVVWFQRSVKNPDEAKMGCRTTPDKWRVSCVDNQWTGSAVNCSHCTTTLHSTRAIIARGCGCLMQRLQVGLDCDWTAESCTRTTQLRPNSSRPGRVSRECCKGKDANQWENGKFYPLPRPNPLTDRHQNLCT